MTTDLRAAARQLYEARRDRDEIFGEDASGFGEPAWDMLLLLASADTSVPIGELLTGAGTAAATATHYVDWLTSRRLASVGDAGAISIGERGRALLTSYLAQRSAS